LVDLGTPFHKQVFGAHSKARRITRYTGTLRHDGNILTKLVNREKTVLLYFPRSKEFTRCFGISAVTLRKVSMVCVGADATDTAYSAMACHLRS
jgi:hypothetical protein